MAQDQTATTATDNRKPSQTPERDLDALEQMYGYYTRDAKAPRVVSELDSRRAA